MELDTLKDLYIEELKDLYSAEKQIVTIKRAREVRETLARMPRGSAELLALRYSGLSYTEVAAATNTKPDQVGTRLRRAHDAFRKEVSRGQHR